MNPKTVRVTYLRQIADQAAELGVDTVAWLAISDLKQDDLADASAVVAVEKFGELITRAVCLSRETGFGVLAGRRLLTATHGVLGMAAAASRSIREAMHIVERFVRIRTEAISIHTREVDGSLEVWFEPAIGLGSASNTVTEIAMVAVKNTFPAPECAPETGDVRIAQEIGHFFDGRPFSEQFQRHAMPD